jgi:hypothetical protein
MVFGIGEIHIRLLSFIRTKIYNMISSSANNKGTIDLPVLAFQIVHFEIETLERS